MIYDKIENMGKYPLLEKVEAFLNEHKGQILENGKYILNENCYLAVSEYQTGDGKDYEAHKEYIDVQMLAYGKENIFVQDIQKGTPCTEYNEVKDIIFYKTEHGVAYQLDENNFLVLDIQDLHKPCVMIEQPEKVKKYVFKIKKV